MTTGSFIGSIDLHRDGRRGLRAHIAIVGAHLEALTGSETFRVPLERCEIFTEGLKIVVRHEDGSLTMATEDAEFLDALEKARQGKLRGQVRRIRKARWRRRALAHGLKGLLIVIVLYFAVGVPIVRWAVAGGVPVLVDQIGESALVQLGLHRDLAPTVEKQLNDIAKQLQPASALSGHTLRVMLAGYTDARTFNLPPDLVVVTSGLVCGAEDLRVVAAAIALELAHLEMRSVRPALVSAVDWFTPIHLLWGSDTKLRERMLDYADSRRTPGYTKEQEEAAEARALVLLREAIAPLESEKDLVKLIGRVRQLQKGAEDSPPSPVGKGKDDGNLWSEAHKEACKLIDGP